MAAELRTRGAKRDLHLPDEVCVGNTVAHRWRVLHAVAPCCIELQHGRAASDQRARPVPAVGRLRARNATRALNASQRLSKAASWK